VIRHCWWKEAVAAIVIGFVVVVGTRRR